MTTTEAIAGDLKTRLFWRPAASLSKKHSDARFAKFIMCALAPSGTTARAFPPVPPIGIVRQDSEESRSRVDFGTSAFQDAQASAARAAAAFEARLERLRADRPLRRAGRLGRPFLYIYPLSLTLEQQHSPLFYSCHFLQGLHPWSDLPYPLYIVSIVTLISLALSLTT